MNWEKIIIVITSLILIIGCEKRININSLVDKEGVKYQQNSQEPLSGKVFELWDNGNKKTEGSYNNGKKDGTWTFWYENGQRESEGTFKDGKPVGQWALYNKDGSIKEVKEY